MLYIKKHAIFLHMAMPIMILLDLIFMLLPLFGVLQNTTLCLYTIASITGLFSIFILDNYFKQVFIFTRVINSKKSITMNDYNDCQKVVNKSYGIFIIYLFLSGILEYITSMIMIMVNDNFKDISVIIGLCSLFTMVIAIANGIGMIYNTKYNYHEIERRYKNGAFFNKKI